MTAILPTSIVPPVKCKFYSLSGLGIGCFSCNWKIVRILEGDFVQASISLNRRNTKDKKYGNEHKTYK